MGVFALAAALLFTGCVSVPYDECEPRHWGYPKLGLSIVKVGSATLQKVCGGSTHWDDGSEIKDHERDQIAACWVEQSKTAYVGCDQPGAIVHELLHAEGLERGVVRKTGAWW